MSFEDIKDGNFVFSVLILIAIIMSVNARVNFSFYPSFDY